MSLIDENGCGTGRQPLLNTDRLWHSNGDEAAPGVTGKTDWLRAPRAIVSISDYAVTNHRSPKQFDSGVLLCQGKLRYPGSLRYLCHDSAARRVGSLFYPSSKLQSTFFQKIE